MNANAKDLLNNIGMQLDRGIFPVVKNGGFVWPRESTVSFKALGKETQHESGRQRRSPAEPWAGSSGWQGPTNKSGPTGGSWSPGEASSFLSTDGGTDYKEALSAVYVAYPGARIWGQEGGFWLHAESSLLHELGRKVNFWLGVSTEKRAVRSWAFWGGNVIGPAWIGPRHTNFPDGSICAYEPRDGTWAFGDSLVELLDIFSVWALRHLHIEVFGRWPGPQVVALPYERLLELADDENCGCGSSNMRYVECCKASDLKRDRIVEAVRFCISTGWTLRHPPASILQFLRNRGQLPRISDLV